MIGVLRVEGEMWKMKKGLPSLLKRSFRNVQSCAVELVMTQLGAYQLSSEGRVTKGTWWWVLAAGQLIGERKWMNAR